jgi:hypothetical protein
MPNGANLISNQPIRELKLKIADIIIEARCADPDTGFMTSPTKQRFLVTQGHSDCVIGVHYGLLPDIELGQQLFAPGDGGWGLYSSGNKYVFQLFVGNLEQSFVHWLAIFEPDFETGEVFIRPVSHLPIIPNPMPSDKEKLCLDPFLAPLDELLVVNLLALGRGLHIHALGVVYEGRGLVFCGVSGAGKSTMAELWKKRNVKILSDDRISLRRKNGKVWAYGTPWHGDARVCLAEEAPLEAIYFIVHGKENRILPLSVNDISTRLMVRCFPTFYQRRGLEHSLSFISGIAYDVPCYELRFTPDQRVIEEVLNHAKP